MTEGRGHARKQSVPAGKVLAQNILRHQAATTSFLAVFQNQDQRGVWPVCKPLHVTDHCTSDELLITDVNFWRPEGLLITSNSN